MKDVFYKVIKVHLAALRKLLYSCSYSTTQKSAFITSLVPIFLIICCRNPKSEQLNEKNASNQINAVPLSSVLYGDNDIFC